MIVWKHSSIAGAAGLCLMLAAAASAQESFRPGETQQYRHALGIIPESLLSGQRSYDGGKGSGGAVLDIPELAPEPALPVPAALMLGNSGSESGPAGALISECYAPVTLPGGQKAPINNSVLAACVRGARILLEEAPPIASAEDILRGNAAQVRGFLKDETAHCTFTPPPPWVWKNPGMSEKFSCYRTDGSGANGGQGLYYDSRGEPAPEAASVGAFGTPEWGLLLSADGRALAGADGGLRKADRLKVKYYQGNKRMREPFTEAATSRLFWALGIPTDHVFFPRQVVCRGCQASPFKARQMQPTTGSQAFDWASVERSFQGVTVEAAPDDEGWEWQALRGAAAGTGQTAQFDVLILASKLVSLTRPKALQNQIKCASHDPRTGQCSSVLAILQDTGSTFGKPATSNSPRGDLNAYSSSPPVFANQGSCSLDGDYFNHQVSEKGRQLLLRRLLAAFGSADGTGSFDRAKVKAVFEAAHFEGIDLNPADGGELDAWTGQLIKRMEEVSAAQCR